MKQYNGKIGDGLTLLKFSTPSCIPCKMLSRTLDDLAPEFPQIDMLDVDCERFPNLASEFRIRNVPACFIVDNKWNTLSQAYGNIDRNTMKVILKGVL